MRNEIKLDLEAKGDDEAVLTPENEPDIEDIKIEDDKTETIGTMGRNTINLIFVDDKIVDEAADQILTQSEKQSSKFLKDLEAENEQRKQRDALDELYPDWKIPAVETAFSVIDNTIEEQFQKARSEARTAAGLDFETKQQQRIRIETEFRERHKRRLESKKEVPQPALEILDADAEIELVGEEDKLLVISETEKLTDINKTENIGEAEETGESLPRDDVYASEEAESEDGVVTGISGYPELFESYLEEEEFVEPSELFVSSYLDKRVDVFFTGLKKIKEKVANAAYKLEDKAAYGIDKIDHFVFKLEARSEKRVTSLKRSLFAVEHYFEKRKKKIAFIATTAIIGSLVITFAVGNFTAYEYMYNGKVLGVVKNQEEVYKTIDVIGNKLVYEHNAEIKIDKKKDITFNRIMAVGKELDDKEDILNRLTYMKDINAKGYAIIVNGNPATILASEKDARSILDKVQNQFAGSGDTNSPYSVSFDETVLIESVETKLGSIESKEKATAKLLAATIQDADGTEKPLLTIETEEVITYYEAMPYSIAYEDTNTKYKGETTVKSKGAEGQKEIIAKVVKTNGKETKREILEEKVISKPVAQVVLRGSKEPPKLVGTGTFVYPIRGTITSRFGYRWGEFHQAIDIAAPIGTPIKASDGGTVCFAGFQGTYGYLVEIDHGGNRKTRYAHCSKLFVKEGQKVYQGMHIANVGSTGNSTGPHVHFEILINGVNKNPLGYL